MRVIHLSIDTFIYFLLWWNCESLSFIGLRLQMYSIEEKQSSTSSLNSKIYMRLIMFLVWHWFGIISWAILFFWLTKSLPKPDNTAVLAKSFCFSSVYLWKNSWGIWSSWHYLQLLHAVLHVILLSDITLKHFSIAKHIFSLH